MNQETHNYGQAAKSRPNNSAQEWRSCVRLLNESLTARAAAGIYPESIQPTTPCNWIDTGNHSNLIDLKLPLPKKIRIWFGNENKKRNFFRFKRLLSVSGRRTVWSTTIIAGKWPVRGFGCLSDECILSVHFLFIHRSNGKRSYRSRHSYSFQRKQIFLLSPETNPNVRLVSSNHYLVITHPPPQTHDQPVVDRICITHDRLDARIPN